ncbi:MAG: ArsR/SmtB family transcription factor, partial [Candidatus Hodarchaeales archaeon]
FEDGKKHAPQWKERIGESQKIFNIFTDEYIVKNPSTYTNTAEIHRITHLLGQIVNTPVSSSNVKSISLIGPNRIGKTSATQIISEEINEKLGINYAQYKKYDEHFWDWWEETDLENTQILFLDNIFPVWNDLTSSSFQDLLMRSKFERIIIVTILDSLEHSWLELKHKTTVPEIFGQKPYEVNFRRANIIEIKEILKRRLESIGKLNLLSSEIIEAISILSLGLPGLALWICRRIPQERLDPNSDVKLSIKEFYELLPNLNFKPALRIVMENNLQVSQELKVIPDNKIWPLVEPLSNISSDIGQSLKQVKKIASTRLPILEEILILNSIFGTVKRSNLQERTGIKDSSLTYQCQQLVRENIISYFKEGREVYYQLNSPMKEALELLFS